MTDTIIDPAVESSGARAADPAGLVRISLRAGTTRVDLAVPGLLPVAELLPELAAEVGVLDATTAHAGYRLVRADGDALHPGYGLADQGVLDGDILLVAVGADDEPPRVYDDVVEAVADTVERAWRPWDAAAARWTGLIAAVSLLAVGAVALGLARDEGVPVLVGGSIAAVLLLAAGTALARARDEQLVGTVVAWLAAPYAAAAGLAAAEDEPVLRLPMAIAGGMVLAVGVIGMAALGRTRFAFLPPLAVGAAAAACGGVLAGADDAEPGAAAAVVLVVAMLVGLVLPSFASAATGLHPPNPQTTAELLEDPEPLEMDEVGHRVAIGREMLLALSATVALLVVASTPMVVDLGVAGAALAGAAAAALLLRTRSFRTYGEVAIGVAGGVGTAIALVISAMVLHPDWRPALAGIGAGVGILVLLAALRPGGVPLRARQAADLAESGTVMALVPLLVLASGLAAAVQPEVF
ncbi:type VII secretion integral membrane protein EccD [Sporichthya polymorpha]|uniref:type VII secretion integral membrane protein EccD n=1 Tax=Sporichthya polymorpha TaxID=35751 RepID=UPI000382BF99|nr:type VII secretion integral membrane protein EccD [Sporichthya polymorpha]